MQQNSEDWIEHIAEQVHLHYKGRKVVIWGSYGVADSIKGSLKEKLMARWYYRQNIWTESQDSIMLLYL